MDIFSMIPAFNLIIDDNTIIINEIPVAKLLSINYAAKEKTTEPQWRIHFIPIGPDGREFVDVDIKCCIVTQGSSMTVLGVELNRKVTFSFNLLIEVIRKQCRLTGMYGDRKISSIIRNPMEVISVVTSLFKS